MSTDKLMLAMAAEEYLKPPFARTFSYMFSQEQFAQDLATTKNAHTVHVADMRKALSDPTWDDSDWEGWYASYLIDMWWLRATQANMQAEPAKTVDAHVVPQPVEFGVNDLAED